jgi:putative sterol carrier protein
MAAIYADANQARTVYTRLFNDVAKGDPKDMESFIKSGMVVKFQMTDPKLDMWVDGRSTPVATMFGEQALKPNLTLTMTGETLHEILLGSLPLGKAMSSRKLKVGGSMFKAMRLESLLHAYQAYYPGIAEAMLGTGA